VLDPRQIRLGLGQQRRLALGVAHLQHLEALQLAPFGPRFLHQPPVLLVKERHLRPAHAVAPAHERVLVRPHQRVAVLQGVVEEGEGAAPVQRHQPQRQLGHLHRQRVLVHAVEAAIGHQPPRQRQPLLRVGGQDGLARVARRRAAVGSDLE